MCFTGNYLIYVSRQVKNTKCLLSVQADLSEEIPSLYNNPVKFLSELALLKVWASYATAQKRLLI